MKNTDSLLSGSSAKYFSLIFAALFLVSPELVLASVPDLMPKDCPLAKAPAQLMAAYMQFSEHKYSPVDLTCAAQLSFKAAEAKPGDIETNVAALAAQMELLDLLSSILDEHLYQEGEAYQDIKQRWKFATANGKKLSSRLSKMSATDPIVGTLLVAYQLSATAKLVDPQVTLQTAHDASKTLQEIVNRPNTEPNDLALLILGRLSLSLPEVYGGDVDNAVTYLKQAYSINSQNISTLRWCADALISANQNDASKQFLNEMLSLQPQVGEAQQFADELKAAYGLAARIGDTALSEKLRANRTTLLKQYPNLRTRQSVAGFGHGGPDPMTGKDTD